MAGTTISGMGLCCALGMDAETCVSAMLAGQMQPSAVPLDSFTEPLAPNYYRIPDGAALFDPGRFERLLPAVVRAAVAPAGLSAAELAALPVFVGSSCFSVGLAEAEYAAALADGVDAVPMPRCDYDYPAKLACEALGSGGDTWAYNTACSSSANALLGAQGLLEAGVYRHALVLGVEYANRTSLGGFSGLQVLAEQVRPFDAARRGMVLGEGLGAVLLSAEPVAGAPRILGGANNCDTHNVTTANPDGRSVAAVLRLALSRTGTDAADVRAIKVHGTGSLSGDQAEAAALIQVFPKMPPLTGLKGHTGHSLGACGVVELVLFAAVLRRGLIPATAGFSTPDPALGLRPLTERRPAPAGRYLLNHFGFGGNNTVLVLEQPA
ncbi:MAG TPA: beta-ketoacyl synthase N-terminal-like domain-containing protein [Gammaproteobacteria bacterium]|nr:beta-ketoacyl synthase N-terminal-like domain-containing protein [Gammaproteobacteria bacterium]